MTRIVFAIVLSFFVIKLPLTDNFMQISFLIIAVIYGLFNFFMEKRQLYGDILGAIGFTFFLFFFSGFSIFEIWGFVFIIGSFLLKMISKIKVKKF